MTILIERALPEHLADPPGVPAAVRLLPVGAALWRVVDPAGRALGHLAGGVEGRYAALRFHAGSGSFREVGRF